MAEGASGQDKRRRPGTGHWAAWRRGLRRRIPGRTWRHAGSMFFPEARKLHVVQVWTDHTCILNSVTFRQLHCCHPVQATVISHLDGGSTLSLDSLLPLYFVSTEEKKSSPWPARAGRALLAGSRCPSGQHKHVLEPQHRARPLCDPDGWKTETRPTL